MAGNPSFEEDPVRDLQELVTQEPDIQTYDSMASSSKLPDIAPGPSATSTSRRRSSSTFPHMPSADDQSSPTEPLQTSLSGLENSRVPSHSVRNAISSASSGWSHYLSPPTPGASVRGPQIERAEKDSDDVETPTESRRPLHRSGASTTTALNRIFSTRPSGSPALSREPSSTKPPGGLAYMRSLASETATLPNHLYNRGFLGGRHSDINVKVFGQVYPLHRIILDRAPFFASALSEPWCEASQKDIELHPEDIDSNITKTAFELALKRLYGCRNTVEEDAEAGGLFATGCWLEMQDLVDASVDSLLRRMHVTDLASTVQLVTANYYGKAGEKILASAKAMLSRDGWEMPLKCWEGIPSDVIRELIGGDGFFVHGEWERFVLAKRLLDRRLKAVARDLNLWPPTAAEMTDNRRHQAIRLDSRRRESFEETWSVLSTDTDPNERWTAIYKHPDIEPLLSLLDEGIHYVHLDFEQLQYIRSTRDTFGVPVLPERIIADSLWSNMELRQRVVNSREKDLTLSLSQAAEFWALETSNDKVMGNGKHLASNVDPPRIVQAHTDSASDASTSLRSSPSENRVRRFWIPTADCNIVIGGNSEPVVTASGSRQQARASSIPINSGDDAPWFSDFFAERSSTPSLSGSRPTSYSTFPPFRFAAEFPNPQYLKERKRVYSRTVFYAGSLWNVYIQKVKSGSKNPQLGVYLHRAKEREPEAPGLANNVEGLTVDERIGALEREMLLSSEHRTRRQGGRRSADSIEIQQTIPNDRVNQSAELAVVSLAGTPQHPGLSTFMTGSPSARPPRHSIPPAASTFAQAETGQQEPEISARHHRRSSSTCTSPLEDSEDAVHLDQGTRHFFHRPYVSTLPPYVDARPTIKTYFKIYSPSKGGRMLSVYESAPDNFNFSQSWGWKSSTLMVDEEVCGGPGPGPGSDFVEGSATGVTGLDIGALDDDNSDLLGGVTAAELEEGRRKGEGKLRFMVVLGVV